MITSYGQALLPLFRGLLVACLSLGVIAGTAEGQEPETVDRVDLERYTGIWFEIARIPNRFQRMCVLGTTASYGLRADGRLDVENRCFREDGKEEVAKGIARIADPASNARLEVSFVRFLGIQAFWGDYWILALGPEYEWAVVGVPSRKYGWILAREPEFDGETRASVDAILEERGYDPADFEESPQERW